MNAKQNEKKKLSPYALLAIIVAAAVVALLIAAALFSVASPSAVMSYEGITVDEEMYCFWFSYYKMQVMSAYGIKGTSDTEKFWQTEMENGVTYGEYFTEIIDDRIKTKVITSYMFDALGAQLPDYGIEEINDYLEATLDYVADGDKKEFDRIAEKYHTSYNAVKKVASFDYKAELLFSLMYGDGSYATKEQKDNYYNENYSRVKVIFINTKTKTVEEDGKSYTVALTDAEIIEKLTLAESVEEKLTKGADIADLIPIYSDEAASTHYENGFYLSLKSDYPVTEVIEASLALSVGEWTRVESDYGIHFISRLPLDEEGYSNKDNSDWFASFDSDVAMTEFDKKILSAIDEVKVNEKNKSKWTIENIKYNYEINPMIKE